MELSGLLEEVDDARLERPGRAAGNVDSFLCDASVRLQPPSFPLSCVFVSSFFASAGDFTLAIVDEWTGNSAGNDDVVCIRMECGIWEKCGRDALFSCGCER